MKSPKLSADFYYQLFLPTPSQPSVFLNFHLGVLLCSLSPPLTKQFCVFHWLLSTDRSLFYFSFLHLNSGIYCIARRTLPHKRIAPLNTTKGDKDSSMPSYFVPDQGTVYTKSEPGVFDSRCAVDDEACVIYAGYFRTIEFERYPIAVLAFVRVLCAFKETLGIIPLLSCFVAQICLTRLVPVILRTRCMHRPTQYLFRS
jgi:hypothetical protein